jgi:hypothetical protein
MRICAGMRHQEEPQPQIQGLLSFACSDDSEYEEGSQERRSEERWWFGEVRQIRGLSCRRTGSEAIPNAVALRRNTFPNF